jgi:hypothetical protein
MAEPGVYVEVTKYLKDDNVISYIVPYSEKFGFTCKQDWFSPVKDLFTLAKSMAPKLISSTLAAVSSALAFGGVQILKKPMYAKAWAGLKEPVSIELKLNFFMGMQNKWDAIEEVYKPILTLMGKTVPGGDNLSLTSPGPTGLDVFGSYSNSVFASIVNSVKSGEDKYTSFDVWKKT